VEDAFVSQQFCHWQSATTKGPGAFAKKTPPHEDPAVQLDNDVESRSVFMMSKSPTSTELTKQVEKPIPPIVSSELLQ
jgi:hypothetical protein